MNYHNILLSSQNYQTGLWKSWLHKRSYTHGKQELQSRSSVISTTAPQPCPRHWHRAGPGHDTGTELALATTLAPSWPWPRHWHRAGPGHDFVRNVSEPLIYHISFANDSTRTLQTLYTKMFGLYTTLLFELQQSYLSGKLVTNVAEAFVTFRLVARIRRLGCRVYPPAIHVCCLGSDYALWCQIEFAAHLCQRERTERKCKNVT